MHYTKAAETGDDLYGTSLPYLVIHLPILMIGSAISFQKTLQSPLRVSWFVWWFNNRLWWVKLQGSLIYINLHLSLYNPNLLVYQWNNLLGLAQYEKEINAKLYIVSTWTSNLELVWCTLQLMSPTLLPIKFDFELENKLLYDVHRLIPHAWSSQYGTVGGVLWAHTRSGASRYG